MHKLDIEIAAASHPQSSRNTFETYITNMHKLAALREEKGQVEQKAQLVDQVITLSAVNLLAGMMKEAAKLRKEVQEIVMFTF